MDDFENRPILKTMMERSSMDWGEAPKYNAEYRRIRWPANVDETASGRSRYLVPMWKSNIRFSLHKKAGGTWNRVRSPDRVKTDTARNLVSDLKLCIKENIPFKTKSIEYKPSTQWIHIYGTPVIKYDLVTGCLSHFTYSGKYDKVISFILRLLEIQVGKIGKKLVWSSLVGQIEVDLNETYNLHMGASLFDRSMLISISLHQEYINICNGYQQLQADRWVQPASGVINTPFTNRILNPNFQPVIHPFTLSA